MILHFADCTLDPDRRTLTRNGATVKVEPQVFDLLALLAENPDRVVTRDEIVEAVWNGRIVSESAISARIAAARKAVGDDGKRQAVIRTVARRGLQMSTEVNEADATPQTDHQTGQAQVQRIRYVRLPSGYSMAYAVTGAGPPVILCGQGTSDLEAEWQFPFERHRFLELSRRNMLVRFDNIGCGQSDRDNGRPGIAERAEDIVALADALQLDRFALYAQSGGSADALKIAAQYPDRVTRLALMGGHAEGRSVREGGNGGDNEPLRAMIAAARTLSGSAFYEAVLLAYQPEGPLEAVRAYSAMMQHAASEDYEATHRDILNRHSSMDILHRITCPTLILHSRHDSVHPLTEARKLAAGIPDAELVVLECANHIPWQGNAAYDGYLATLTEFLAVAGGER